LLQLYMVSSWLTTEINYNLIAYLLGMEVL